MHRSSPQLAKLAAIWTLRRRHHLIHRTLYLPSHKQAQIYCSDFAGSVQTPVLLRIHADFTRIAPEVGYNKRCVWNPKPHKFTVYVRVSLFAGSSEKQKKLDCFFIPGLICSMLAPSWTKSCTAGPVWGATCGAKKKIPVFPNQGFILWGYIYFYWAGGGANG